MTDPRRGPLGRGDNHTLRKCDHGPWFGAPKVRDVIKAMEQDGWALDRTRGDHRQYVHPARPEAVTVTVPGHPGDDLPAGTLNSILKKAGLKK